MSYLLTEEQESLRQMVRRLVEEKVAPGAAEREEKGEYPWDIVEIFREHGLFALFIPEEYGGQGGRVLDQVVVAEEVAKGCNSSAAVLSFGNLGPVPILLGGSEEQKRKYLPRMASGELLGAYALSEPEAGSDAASLQTRAILEGNNYVLSGRKIFISNFDAASIVIVFARTDPQARPARGISAFVLEKEPDQVPPGISDLRSLPKMSMRAMHTFEFAMDDLRIPKENLLGKEGEGFKYALATLDRGRMIVGAQGVGTAQAALDYAVNWAKQRVQFGRPIGALQGVQFMLADMATEIEAARQLVYLAAAHCDRGGPDIAYYGAIAKLFATDVAMKATTEAVQVLGGYGYIKDHPVERWMRDAKAMQIYEGTNQVQRVVIARRLLGRL